MNKARDMKTPIKQNGIDIQQLTKAEFRRLVREQSDSLDDILYNTTIHIGCDYDELLIGKVLQKLPKNIRSYVQENVQFFVANSSSYYKIEPQFQKPNTIVLRFEERDTTKKKMTTIAHEIAHAWIFRNNPCPNGGLQEERGADDLCEKWGFGRAYKNYKMFEGFEKIKKGK